MIDKAKGLPRRKCLSKILANLAIGIGCLQPFFVHAALSNTMPIIKIAPFEYSNNSLSADRVTYAYRPWFENGTWQGDLVQYEITIDQNQTVILNTSVDLSGRVPANNGVNWSAHANMSKKSLDWWQQRKVLMFDAQSQHQRPFRHEHFSESQKDAMRSEVVNYIRGDRSLEGEGGMRVRYSLLGDIINSNPAYVDQPSEWYADPSYLDYMKQFKDRSPQIVVGANDGMVHVFNADDGEEIFAYVPSVVLPNLTGYTAPGYDHIYYADGGINVRDVRLGPRWATIAVGGLGAGGVGLWALDLTYPLMGREDSVASKDKKLLWQIMSKEEVGHIFGRPPIVRMKDATNKMQFYIVHGSGYHTKKQSGKLFIRDVETGSVESELVAKGSVGMSTPALVDASGDGVADYAYAGDHNGGIWRFNLSPGPEIKFAHKILQLPNAEANPILITPQVVRHPVSGLMVYVVSGKVMSLGDVKKRQKRWVVGVWDKSPWVTGTDAVTVNWRDLQLQKWVDLDHKIYRSLTKNNVDYRTQFGWKVELDKGLVGITNPVFRTGRLKLTVTQPIVREKKLDSGQVVSLLDNAQQKNWDIEFEYLTGGRTLAPVYDMNGDGLLTYLDKIAGVAPMMKMQRVGLRSEPTSMRLPPAGMHTVDLLLHNQLVLGESSRVVFRQGSICPEINQHDPSCPAEDKFEPLMVDGSLEGATIMSKVPPPNLGQQSWIDSYSD